LFRHPVPPRRIAAHLARGGLIAYPTESCYGLGCDPRNRRAVQRLLKIKGRPQHKGLILIAGRVEQLASYLQPLTSAQRAELRSGGAQAVTFLMPARADCPRWLRGMYASLAVRITAHSGAAALCNGVNMALVSTSANRSGDKPVRNYADCLRRFGGRALVLPGQVGKRRRPSTIRDWASGRIIRN
jgi:L-threonylcarbamoyladenylate synthase